MQLFFSMSSEQPGNAASSVHYANICQTPCHNRPRAASVAALQDSLCDAAVIVALTAIAV